MDSLCWCSSLATLLEMLALLRMLIGVLLVFNVFPRMALLATLMGAISGWTRIIHGVLLLTDAASGWTLVLSLTVNSLVIQLSLWPSR